MRASQNHFPPAMQMRKKATVSDTDTSAIIAGVAEDYDHFPHIVHFRIRPPLACLGDEVDEGGRGPRAADDTYQDSKVL